MRCRYTRALRRAMRDSLEREHRHLRVEITRWRPDLYYFNEKLTRNRWGW